MKCLCNRWVFVWNSRTLKDMVQFVHEVHPDFFIILSTFAPCYVGQMMIPCQVSTFFEFSCSAFQFQGHLAQNKSLNAWKIANEVRKGWNFSMWLECCILDAKKVLSWNKLRKMKCLCNRWVLVWNPCTLKEMVQFVHEVHPVLS